MTNEDDGLAAGTVLVLDTAGRACQVGVFADGGLRLSRRVEMVHGQAEKLMPLLDAALAEAGVAYAGVGAVVVTVGPGSFTGLRVGLAAAHGLGLAIGCPVVGVSSLAAWAMSVLPQATGRFVRVALDSRRGDAFVQDFDAAGTAIAPPAIQPVAEALAAKAGMLLCGDLVAGGVAPTIEGVYAAARIAAHRCPAEPMYLRPADAVPQDNRGVAPCR